MNRLTAGVFALLVVATFGAFFVAQRLKNAPPVLGRDRCAPGLLAQRRRPLRRHPPDLPPQGDRRRLGLGHQRQRRRGARAPRWASRGERRARAPEVGRAHRRRHARARRPLPLSHHAPARGTQRAARELGAARHDAAAPAGHVDRAEPRVRARAHAQRRRRRRAPPDAGTPPRDPAVQDRARAHAPGARGRLAARRREGLDVERQDAERAAGLGRDLPGLDRDARRGRQPRPLAAADPRRSAGRELRRAGFPGTAASRSATSACARPTWPRRRATRSSSSSTRGASRGPGRCAASARARRRRAAGRPRRACACMRLAASRASTSCRCARPRTPPRCPSRSRAPSATASSWSCRS